MEPALDAGTEAALVAVLLEARHLGFLGPGPVESHLVHSLGFAAAIDEHAAPGRALDLGSGGGVPGLVLAACWEASRWVLVDAGERRAQFLEWAVDRLALGSRVHVRRGRAERLAHEPDLRAAFDLVVARGFGPPAVTAECAAGFLAVGGRLVVSEPPTEETDRWPAGAVRLLGLQPEPLVVGIGRYRVLRQIEACPARYPRREGIPAKRPLF